MYNIAFAAVNSSKADRHKHKSIRTNRCQVARRRRTLLRSLVRYKSITFADLVRISHDDSADDLAVLRQPYDQLSCRHSFQKLNLNLTHWLEVKQELVIIQAGIQVL